MKTFLGLIKKQKQKQQNNKNKETKKQTSQPPPKNTPKKGKENLKTQQFNGWKTWFLFKKKLFKILFDWKLSILKKNSDAIGKF